MANYYRRLVKYLYVFSQVGVTSALLIVSVSGYIDPDQYGESNMGKYLDSFFDHEVGNKHMKMYKVYSNWSGLTKKSFFKHKECWPMFVVTAVTAVGTFWYLYRLGAQVDSGVNRFDKRVHRMGIQDDISIATFIDHKAVNPQTKMPHLDEYKLDY